MGDVVDELAREEMREVELGKAGLRVSQLSFGTGTRGDGRSSEQTRMGCGKLVDLLRYAYDQGITFWDSADAYGSHGHVAEALKGINRSSVTVTTKTGHTCYGFQDAERAVERYLQELNTDYIDMVLLHYVTEPNWAARYAGAMDALSRAKEKGLVRAVGIACHGLEVLETVASNPWVEVLLARINPYGSHMDSSPEEVVPVLREIHAAGKGIYAMKVFGQGDLAKPDKKKTCIDYVLNLDCVDAITIGMTNQEQVRENLSLCQGYKSGSESRGLEDTDTP